MSKFVFQCLLNTQGVVEIRDYPGRIFIDRLVTHKDMAIQYEDDDLVHLPSF